MIEIRNLEKSFGANKVLQGINLKIPDGKTMVIIGESGCGKSVLLKHIIGIMKPDGGQILVDNINVFDLNIKQLNKLRLKFGMVFQASALFDSLTIKENVGFSLYEHTDVKQEEISKRIKESLNMVGLSGIESKMPAEISGGMKKRVALARAIIMNPEIILYDEPTVGIDPIRSGSINNLIKRLHGELNVTSLVVTHDMQSAYYVADRIAMMYKGKIIEEGTPSEIKKSDNPIVQQFVNGVSNE